VRLLLSFFYYRDEDLTKLLTESFGDIPIDVFADSGAYSAFTQGKPVVEADYIAWVKKWQHHFTAVAGPDVIGNAQETKMATLRMRQQVTGIPVLPTFHVGEDWAYLDFWAKEADYIAFGGMVPYTRRLPLLTAWLDKAFKRTPAGVKVHGFGMTTWPLLLRFPWYSVDSSSWTAGFRYAQLALFDEQRGRFIEIKMNERESLLKNAKLLERYGIRPTQARSDKYDRDLLVGVAVASWQRAEEWLNKTNLHLCTWPHGAGGDTRDIGRGMGLYLGTTGLPKAEGGPNHPVTMARALKKAP
jgi:hypothetical protein